MIVNIAAMLYKDNSYLYLVSQVCAVVVVGKDLP
jgi:hypothetical protein